MEVHRIPGSGLPSRVVTDIEGGNIRRAEKLGEDHFRLEMRPDEPSTYAYPEHHGYWFHFRLEGVKHRSMLIELTNCDWMPGHWSHYRPVFSYTADPGSLREPVWKRVEDTKLAGRIFAFRQRFEQDAVWLALRYPYTLSRLARYIDTVREKRHAQVVIPGRSALGQPLYMIRITDDGARAQRKKLVLVYAREHGVEQDGSWVAEGLCDFLLSRDPTAAALRRHLVFLIVPAVDPDAVVLGRAVNPGTGRTMAEALTEETIRCREARMMYDEVRKNVENGCDLDVCLSLHNPHGTEPNIYPYFRPYRSPQRLKRCRALHRGVLSNAAGYTRWKEHTSRSCIYSVGRFARDFGAVAILYEFNHQARRNFLSLPQLKKLGEVLARGLAQFYALDPWS